MPWHPRYSDDLGYSLMEVLLDQYMKSRRTMQSPSAKASRGRNLRDRSFRYRLVDIMLHCTLTNQARLAELIRERADMDDSEMGQYLVRSVETQYVYRDVCQDLPITREGVKDWIDFYNRSTKRRGKQRVALLTETVRRLTKYTIASFRVDALKYLVEEHCTEISSELVHVLLVGRNSLVAAASGDPVQIRIMLDIVWPKFKQLRNIRIFADLVRLGFLDLAQQMVDAGVDTRSNELWEDISDNLPKIEQFKWLLEKRAERKGLKRKATGRENKETNLSGRLKRRKIDDVAADSDSESESDGFDNDRDRTGFGGHVHRYHQGVLVSMEDDMSFSDEYSDDDEPLVSFGPGYMRFSRLGPLSDLDEHKGKPLSDAGLYRFVIRRVFKDALLNRLPYVEAVVASGAAVNATVINNVFEQRDGRYQEKQLEVLQRLLTGRNQSWCEGPECQELLINILVKRQNADAFCVLLNAVPRDFKLQWPKVLAATRTSAVRRRALGMLEHLMSHRFKQAVTKVDLNALRRWQVTSEKRDAESLELFSDLYQTAQDMRNLHKNAPILHPTRVMREYVYNDQLVDLTELSLLFDLLYNHPTYNNLNVLVDRYADHVDWRIRNVRLSIIDPVKIKSSEGHRIVAYDRDQVDSIREAQDNEIRRRRHPSGEPWSPASLDAIRAVLPAPMDQEDLFLELPSFLSPFSFVQRVRVFAAPKRVGYWLSMRYFILWMVRQRTDSPSAVNAFNKLQGSEVLLRNIFEFLPKTMCRVVVTTVGGGLW
eukprot:GILJ01006531.1.p1 GENE.GILJ01006531.1~~GILJ01006531.1.p1  ORF type:complete len:804 (-),score=99.10 GILJ01006531.1:376-2679(-)